jgi:hypothetical protein
MPIAFEDRLARAQKIFWLAFAIFVVTLISVIWGIRCLGGQTDSSVEPILKGAPQFIVLSLVVAFAVYLRQVSTNASELRDNIKSGKVWNYPPGKAHTEDKLQALDGVCEKIGITAPFMILLTIAAAGRIVFDALLKFPRLAALHINSALFLVDLGIALWIFFLFFALAIFHARGRRRDSNIRINTRANEDECLRNFAHNANLNPIAEPHTPTPESAPTLKARSPIPGILFAFALLLLVCPPRRNNRDIRVTK